MIFSQTLQFGKETLILQNPATVQYTDNGIRIVLNYS